MTKGTRLILRVGYKTQEAQRALRILKNWMIDNAGGCTEQTNLGYWVDGEGDLQEECSVTLVCTLLFHPVTEAALASLYTTVDEYKKASGEEAVLLEIDTINCEML